MAISYLDLKAKQQKEVNDFPMVFAFGNKQFAEAMAQLGLTETDTDKVYSIGGGGFIRKTDSDSFEGLFTRHEKEMQDAIDGDPTGDGFIYTMFDYELGNHEYSYTWDIEPTLAALGLTKDQVEANPKLKHGLLKARKNQRAE